MAHILFADINESALRTMMRAQALGHQTSVIRNTSWQVYHDTEWTRNTLAAAEIDIAIPVTSESYTMTQAIESVHRRHPIAAVVAQLEPAIEATAVACERLAIPFTCSQGIRAARNKGRTRDVLEAAGLASARHAVVHDVAQALLVAQDMGYPVVAKPVSGMDSMLAFRADNPSALREAAERIAGGPRHLPAQITEQMSRGILIEEYLTGELVSVELAFVGGHCFPIVVCGRSRGVDNDCIEMGASVPAGVSGAEGQRCISYARAACEAVGLDFGMFHVEMMVSSKGPVLVELNPRPMGGIMTEMYARLTGREFSDYILDVYQRQPPRDIVRLSGSTTITARKLIAVHDGTLPNRMDLSWVGREPRLLAVHPYRMDPGSQFDAGQVLGRFVVMDDTWKATMSYADGLIERFEASMGTVLHHSRSAQD